MKRFILFISLIGLVVMFYLTLPKTKPIVVVCDVGQGDAILATYKNIQLLVDTGPNNKKVLGCLENHLPFWDKTIEAVILTHGDSDHIGGLDDLIKNYEVRNFFSNGYLDKEIEQKIYSKKISQNDVISLGLFYFEVVWPEENGENRPADSDAVLAGKDGNENSVAGILSVKEETTPKAWHLGGQVWSMFLSGDMEAEAEQKLVWREILDKPVKVLKVSHHGSKTATSQELLETLKPKMAVISVGKNNRYGHPTEEVIKRIQDLGIEILRTDMDGEIIFGSDLLIGR